MRILSRTARKTYRINWRNRANLLRLSALLVIAAFVTVGLLFLDQLTFAAVGYTGIALLSLIASGGLVLPVPAMAAVCTASVFLSPVVLGLVAGSAETVGELTGYFLGYSGRDLVRQGRWYPRVEGWMRKRGWLLLLVLSLVPNPVFDVAGVAAGAVRYPLPAFMGVVLIGKVAKFIGISYACALSIEWVIRTFV
ncbi:MAG: VTT domain-containing protein [Dehalococcoidia bacterium]